MKGVTVWEALLAFWCVVSIVIFLASPAVGVASILEKGGDALDRANPLKEVAVDVGKLIDGGVEKIVIELGTLTVSGRRIPGAGIFAVLLPLGFLAYLTIRLFEKAAKSERMFDDFLTAGLGTLVYCAGVKVVIKAGLEPAQYLLRKEIYLPLLGILFLYTLVQRKERRNFWHTVFVGFVVFLLVLGGPFLGGIATLLEWGLAFEGKVMASSAWRLVWGGVGMVFLVAVLSHEKKAGGGG